MSKVKKHTKRKGFTLVEIIIVLVILAILAAIAIPAMVNYIDKGNEGAVLAEARTALVGAQAISTDEYGKGTSASGMIAAVTKTSIGTISGGDLPGTLDSVVVNDDGVVTKLSYTNYKKTATFLNGVWTITAAGSTPGTPGGTGTTPVPPTPTPTLAPTPTPTLAPTPSPTPTPPKACLVARSL